MQHMFHGAVTFNDDVSSWDVSSVTAMQSMFFEAEAFGQTLCGPTWVSRYSLLSTWVPHIIDNVCNCPPGMLLKKDYSWANYGQYLCETCPAGRYQPNYNAIETTPHCLQCEAGKYSEEGSQHCSACPNGLISTDSAPSCATQCQRQWSGPDCTVFTPTVYCNSGFCQDDYLKRRPECELAWCIKDYPLADYLRIYARINLAIALYDCTQMTADGPDEEKCGMTPARRNPTDWDVSKVTDMNALFYDTDEDVIFNGDISGWTTTQVTTMSEMFRDAAVFNGDISEWDVGAVTTMAHMFHGATAFNRDISKWNTVAVTTMAHMFHGAAAFDQDLSKWNVFSVTDMQHLFHGANSFNQDISKWSVGKVTTMAHMFRNATDFNQFIRADTYSLNKGLEGIWDLQRVSDMTKMFYGASAFQMTEQVIDGRLYNIHMWNVPSNTITTDMFVDSGLSQNPSWYSS